MTEEEPNAKRSPGTGDDTGTLQVTQLLCDYCVDPPAIDTDAHVASHAAMYNFDMPLFYMKWLRDIQAQQDKETGDLPHISPRTAVTGRISESCAYVLLTWYFHLQYGDIAILERHYDGIRRYVEFLHRTSADHILPVTPKETGDGRPGINEHGVQLLQHTDRRTRREDSGQRRGRCQILAAGRRHPSRLQRQVPGPGYRTVWQWLSS